MMEKLKCLQKIIQNDNIKVFFIIFISIIGISLNVTIVSSDELWNFQNVYKLYNGFEIYKDANVICTPLFFFIGKALFDLLGANFFIFRIYNIIINVSLFFSTYILCKKLKISKKTSLLIVFILMVIGNYTITLCMANYNILALTFFIIGVILLLNNNLEKKVLFIQGIILFLILFTKQNFGIYYLMASITVIILKKSRVKEKIFNIVILSIPSIVLGIITILYFSVNNTLNEFINYTILGIKEFGTENIYINFILFIIFFVIIILNIFLIKNIMKAHFLDDFQKENLKRLFIFSVFLSFSIFPIVNKVHFCIGIYLALIFLSYNINLIINDIFGKKAITIQKIILYILVALSIMLSIYNFVLWIMNMENNYQFDKESPYYGGILDDQTYSKIENITTYIKQNNRKVIVLSQDAALYMVPLKESNGEMDLPFKGNLGKEGESGLLNKIKNLKDTEILIKKDENEMNWQESKQIRQYIVNNLNCIGEIEYFLIYLSY